VLGNGVFFATFQHGLLELTQPGLQVIWGYLSIGALKEQPVSVKVILL